MNMEERLAAAKSKVVARQTNEFNSWETKDSFNITPKVKRQRPKKGQALNEQELTEWKHRLEDAAEPYHQIEAIRRRFRSVLSLANLNGVPMRQLSKWGGVTLQTVFSSIHTQRKYEEMRAEELQVDDSEVIDRIVHERVLDELAAARAKKARIKKQLRFSGKRK